MTTLAPVLPLPQAGRAVQVTRYIVVCRSSSGWFEVEVEATSHHRAISRAWTFIQQSGWDGVPVRARHAH